MLDLGFELSALFTAVLWVVALSQVRAVWSGRSIPRIERNLRPWWLWGEGMLQGYLRAMVALIIPVTAMIIGAFAAILRELTVDPVVWRVAHVVLVVGFVSFMVGFVPIITVVLFNWPKLLVPPSLRHQPGLLSHLFGKQLSRLFGKQPAPDRPDEPADRR